MRHAQRALQVGAVLAGVIGGCAPSWAHSAFVMGAVPLSSSGSSAPDVPTLRHLLHLQSDAQVLALQVKIAKLREALKTAGHPAAEGASGPPGSQSPLQKSLNQPRVRKVSGTPGHLVAVVELPGRQTIRVRVGQSLPGGERVIRVRPHTVMVRGPKGVQVLPWRAAANTNTNIMGGFGGAGGYGGISTPLMSSTPGMMP